MSKIEGGAKKWKEAVKKNSYIDSAKLVAIAYYLEKKQEQSGYQIFEARISKYAPDDKAASKYDFLSNISNKLSGKIEIVDNEKSHIISEPDAVYALNYFFTEAKSALGNGKYVFKCATGLGKTEEIIKCNNLAECVIAFPSHKLKDEVSERFNQKGVQHLVIPELPTLPISIKQEYDSLSNIGAYEEAAALLWQISSGENIAKFFISDQELRRTQEDLASYFKKIEDCQNTTFPVLTTHKKLLTTEFPNHSTYIIDEDILPSLFEIKSTTAKDLRMIINKLKYENLPEYVKGVLKLSQFVNDLGKTYLGEVTDSEVIKNQISADYLKKIVSVALKNGLLMEGSPIGLFTSDFFFVNAKDEKNDPDGEIEISYLKKSQLPLDKKIIVLSATADEDIYKEVFPEMEWQELTQVEQKGTLVQIFDHSFSRAWMNRSENQEIIKYVREFAQERPVITYNKHKGRFKNSPDLCLESSEGFDELKGMDIVIVGTPHLKPSYYALLATALGIQFSSNDLKFDMVRCEHRNQRFDFFTFKHEGLRKVQFYKIESQLTQACGRARTLRESATVYLFSSFPLEGFEKITLTELRQREFQNPLLQLSFVSTASGSLAA
jgi:hypothetical protein